MAFEQPLEADRVDDLGLFSVFLRAPVVGTIMWMIGGDMAKQRDEEEKVKQELVQDSDGAGVTTERRGRRSPLLESTQCVDISGSKKRSPPQLLGSDISHFGEFASEQEALHAHHAVSAETAAEVDEPNLKRSKKMSWSDESGQDLAVVIDEAEHDGRDSSNSSPLLPSSTAGSKPVKSAMRRSRSMKANIGLERRGKSSKLAPKGFGGGANGLVMPTKPFGVASNGCVSPEWGWYIRTTPPTPEMYQASRTSQKPVPAETAAPTQQLEQLNLSAEPPTLLSNPAFGRSKRAAGVGWPSVPL